MSKVQGFFSIVTMAILALVAIPFAVHATNYGGGSVQGYSSASSLDNGTIVELTGKDLDHVKAATQKNLQNMFGVVVDRNQIPVRISNESRNNETFVAVSGNYNVLVSDQAGPIKSGDYITLSSVNGVAMKAGSDEDMVFGRANRDFDGKGVTMGTTTLKDSNGDTKTVKLGSIPTTIDIRKNPNEKSTKADLPEMLQRVGQAIAEKEVSPIRIYLSLGITAVSLIAAIAVLYAGVRSGVISIGRNPMSKKSIFRALLEVILTSLLILIVGLFAVYLLLKL